MVIENKTMCANAAFIAIHLLSLLHCSATNKAVLAKAARLDDLPVVVMNEQCRKMVDVSTVLMRERL
jgi:hypothetical protein